MSESTWDLYALGSDESPADALNEALLQFAACVGTSIPDICSYSLTIGETYVPFEPDPEDECPENASLCSQIWVRVMNVGVLNTGAEGWGGNSCAVALSMQLEVGVIRCIEIPGEGEAPSATDVMIAATQSMDDMNRLLCAAMSCEVWEAIDIGTWTPMGPLGGQYGGIWTFTVEPK